MKVLNYRELIVWQKALDLVEFVYLLTRKFPKDELYGLTSQMRRASVSVPANIAEGQGRKGTGEFLHFLSISHGSLREVETHGFIAARLQYILDEDLKQLLDRCSEVGRLLNGLSNSLSR
jgi:four helix bundle protein